jgi:hypothetical protein
VLELLDELVAVRDAAHRHDLVARGMRPCIGDVLRDRAVEQEVVLQHDAQVRAEVAQLDRRQIMAVDEDAAGLRPVERHRQADERALARSARTDQGCRRSGWRIERHVLQYRDAWVVLERDILERNVPAHILQRHPISVLLIFGRHPADLADAVEPRERFRELRSDRRELNHRHRHHRGEGQIHHQFADRHRAVPDRVAADQHHGDAGGADHERRERGRR